ncbi:MAG: histidinol dehydrogenase [Halieaceae bacterium]|jgi:histidinol dehydrogenase
MVNPIRRLNRQDADFESQLKSLLERPEERDGALSSTVADIIETVRHEGDEAVLRYTRSLDRHTAETISDLTIERDTLEAALDTLDPALAEALKTAASRIEQYHQHQLVSDWGYEDEYGNHLGQRILAMSRVGLYVPGGKASYPSSVLMNGIPAKVAGVEEIIMVVPAPEGELSEVVLAAAALAGVTRVFTIGGAQAIAALAYGTPSIPRVDKIVGPGNRFVAEAKRQVFGLVGIDMVAGPSEVLVIADGSVSPEWVAVDLFSQAEHDEQAQALLIATDADYLDAVEKALKAELPNMDRAQIIQASLENRGAFIQVETLEDAFALSNQIGPEHLELAIENAGNYLDRVKVAGAVFVGGDTCESLGDYCAGPNHVLPTSSTARFSSPLGVYDFQKRTSVVHCSASGASALGDVASVLARAESLTAHARSAELRVKK